MNRRAVLFVDIDGVLNSQQSVERFGTFQKLDPMCVALLRQEVEHNDACIVISSTWRFDPVWRETIGAALAEAGWSNPPLLDRTSMIDDASRGAEIQRWIDGHDVERCVIIDDDDDMLFEQFAFFVQCSFETGFTTEDAANVRRIIKEA